MVYLETLFGLSMYFELDLKNVIQYLLKISAFQFSLTSEVPANILLNAPISLDYDCSRKLRFLPISKLRFSRL